jgi:hypothetical protein
MNLKHLVYRLFNLFDEYIKKSLFLIKIMYTSWKLSIESMYVLQKIKIDI